MPTRNINLTEHYDRFVQAQVDAGIFKNASEVMRAGLRLLEHETRTREEKLALLKKMAHSGFAALDQGEELSFASDDALAGAIAKIGRRAAKASPDRTKAR